MTSAITTQNQRFERRRARVRAKISGTALRPRLTIFKSHRYLYAQLIDDEAGRTLASADSRKATGKKPVERATEVGAEIAKKAKAAKIGKVVFDRNGYMYAGKIRMVAEAARAGGLEF